MVTPPRALCRKSCSASAACAAPGIQPSVPHELARRGLPFGIGSQKLVAGKSFADAPRSPNNSAFHDPHTPRLASTGLFGPDGLRLKTVATLEALADKSWARPRANPANKDEPFRRRCSPPRLALRQYVSELHGKVSAKSALWFAARE
jgi:hypothetical protein